ncbi:MAG: hypothetical protein QM538_02580 [Methylacidiphilales bacterium]|nr:hypothetical protein [Candidatus Methylacidiphilales bacterium]
MCLGYIAITSTYSETLKDVQLQEYTNLTITIAPLLGTRLSFPVILDNADATIPFTLDLTNAGLFQITRHEGRNYFLISAPASIAQENQGSLFIQVAGKFIAIRLAIGSPEQHIDEIRFNFTPEESNHLIQLVINKELQKIQKEYQSLSDSLKSTHCQEAQDLVALLVSKTITKDNIFLRKTFNQGVALIDYLALIGNDKHLALAFILNQPSPIQHLKLRGMSIEGNDELLSKSFACQDTLDNNEIHCSIALKHNFTLEQFPVLFLTVSTNNSNSEIPW